MVAGSVLAGVSVGGPGQAAAAVRTARVQRGTVVSTVSASGTVSGAETLDLSFGTAGQVSAVYVSPGQVVSAGQALAQLDPATAQANLGTAQANLAAAQANLAAAQAGIQVQLDQNSVSQAQANLAAAQAAGCPDPPQGAVADPGPSASSGSPQGAAGTSAAPSASSPSPPQGAAGTSPAPSASPSTTANVCTTDQNALTAAQLNLQQAQFSQQASVAQAQASVAQAQASVDTAQKALSQTTLTAPVGGTVSAVMVQVGENVGAGPGVSVTTQTSSGGSSQAAGAGAGQGPSASSSTSASASQSASSSSAAVSLIDTSSYQLVAGFSEIDASKIQVGQPAKVSFDALPSTQVAATVAAIAPTSTVSGNVVTYQVTLDLDNTPPGLRQGMTGTATVITEERDNVINVPNSAIRAGTVTVMQGGREVVTPVVTGFQGDSNETVVLPSATGSSALSSLLAGNGPLSGGRFGGFGGGGFGGGGFGGGGLGGGLRARGGAG
jgi:macrolide-specific efflux system membrane fusion protein